MWEEQNKFKFGQRVYFYRTKRDEESGLPTVFTVRAIRCTDEGVYEYSCGDSDWQPEDKLFIKNGMPT